MPSYTVIPHTRSITVAPDSRFHGLQSAVPYQTSCLRVWKYREEGVCVCVCGGSRWLASGERYVDVVVVYGESMRQLESDGGEVGEWLIS